MRRQFIKYHINQAGRVLNWPLTAGEMQFKVTVMGGSTCTYKQCNEDKDNQFKILKAYHLILY